MASQEERLMILKMIDEGKISAEEGARLLSAINATKELAESDSPIEASGPSARTVRIRVSDPVTEHEKVNVNLPIGLVEFGFRFVPDTSDARIEDVRTAIRAGRRGRVVDIEDRADGNRVEVYLE